MKGSRVRITSMALKYLLEILQNRVSFLFHTNLRSCRSLAEFAIENTPQAGSPASPRGIFKTEGLSAQKKQSTFYPRCLNQPLIIIIASVTVTADQLLDLFRWREDISDGRVMI